MNNLKHQEQLRNIFNNVNEWLKFAEAKNFGLLSLNAAIVFGFSQTTFGQDSIIEKAGFWVFAPISVMSFLVSLISLFPILSKIEKGKKIKTWIDWICNLFGKDKKFENIHFYGYLKDIEDDSFEAIYLEKVKSTEQFTPYEKELSGQILYNSRITYLKYQFFKVGVIFFITGLVCFIIALPILKIWF